MAYNDDRDPLFIFRHKKSGKICFRNLEISDELLQFLDSACDKTEKGEKRKEKIKKILKMNWIKSMDDLQIVWNDKLLGALNFPSSLNKKIDAHFTKNCIKSNQSKDLFSYMDSLFYSVSALKISQISVECNGKTLSVKSASDLVKSMPTLKPNKQAGKEKQKLSKCSNESGMDLFEKISKDNENSKSNGENSTESKMKNSKIQDNSNNLENSKIFVENADPVFESGFAHRPFLKFVLNSHDFMVNSVRFKANPDSYSGGEVALHKSSVGKLDLIDEYFGYLKPINRFKTRLEASNDGKNWDLLKDDLEKHYIAKIFYKNRTKQFYKMFRLVKSNPMSVDKTKLKITEFELRGKCRNLREVEYKLFSPESDFDQNGVMFFLGTQGGRNSWMNPKERGFVSLECSGHVLGSEIDLVVGRKTGRFATLPEPNSWVSISLKEGFSVLPTHYSLRHYSSFDTEILRSWKLQGLKEIQKTWTDIVAHKNDESLDKAGATHTWKVAPQSSYFTAFRILQTDFNSNKHHYLALSGFEVYGVLKYKSGFFNELDIVDLKKRSHIDFGIDGILYYLGTKAFLSEWTNPAQTGLAEVKCSSLSKGSNSFKKVCGLETLNISTENIPKSWFSLTFTCCKLKLEAYSLRHYSEFDKEALRHWVLQASRDKIKWKTLKKHKKDPSLYGRGCTKTWPVQTSEYFRHFRILQTGENSNSNHILACSGIEFYGSVRFDDHKQFHSAPRSKIDTKIKFIKSPFAYSKKQKPKIKTENSENNTKYSKSSVNGVKSEQNLSQMFKQENEEKIKSPKNPKLLFASGRQEPKETHSRNRLLNENKEYAFFKNFEISEKLIHDKKLKDEEKIILQRSDHSKLKGRIFGKTLVEMPLQKSDFCQKALNCDGIIQFEKFLDDFAPCGEKISKEPKSFGSFDPESFAPCGGAKDSCGSPESFGFLKAPKRVENIYSGRKENIDKNPGAKNTCEIVRHSNEQQGAFSECPIVPVQTGNERRPSKDSFNPFFEQSWKSNFDSFGRLENKEVFHNRANNWDDKRHSPLMHLNPDDHSVVKNGYEDVWQVCLSRRVFSEGELKCQIKILNEGSTSNRWRTVVGVVPHDFDYTKAHCISQQVGWGYISGCGSKIDKTQIEKKYGEPFKSGDTIGITLSFKDGQLRFYKNGQCQGVAFKGLAGPVRVAVCFTGFLSSASLEFFDSDFDL